MPHKMTKMNLAHLLENYREVGPLYGAGASFTYTRDFDGYWVRIDHTIEGSDERTSVCVFIQGEEAAGRERVYFEMRNVDLSHLPKIERICAQAYNLMMTAHAELDANAGAWR